MTQKPDSKLISIPVTTIADRSQLIAYLKYAVDEVATYSETSASLLLMAITDLEESPPRLQAREPFQKHS
jgi:hypothetical protein